jgi:hypothetical protein
MMENMKDFWGTKDIEEGPMTIAFVPWSSLSPIVGLEAYVTN